ncbi:hypothetical protein KV697_16755 [Sphingomonas sanguinis]|uniref:hypothetical protein n=1 Tax=Sphingomonas sanguinis TaxID=33051 RepID=UPI001C56E137|nr:hypothetical protein [Sphingomonas sanguinis]QXT35368.1 hypothetical protein KV697_16755 [Sphingomonas sanguinis]
MDEGSNTARNLISDAAGKNVIFNIIRIDTKDGGNQDGYYPDTNTLAWDPFSGVTFTQNGQSISVEPIMALAHELAHAVYGSSEDKAMATANQIAKEMNESFGSSYYSNRTVYGQGSYFNTDSIDSKDYSISRGDASCK